METELLILEWVGSEKYIELVDSFWRLISSCCMEQIRVICTVVN